MASILVVDPSALCQELFPPVLQQLGYQTEACSAPDATATIANTHPDLVILETGNAAGLALLQSLRTQEQYKALPVIVLTDQTSRSAILEAARLGVRDYMLKQRFSKAELLGRLRKYIAPHGAVISAETIPVPGDAGPAGKAMPDAWATLGEDDQAIRDAALAHGIPLLTREQMLVRLESAKVKTLPGAVSELLALLNSPRGSVVDVATILRRDPVLSAKVLRLANSAALSSNRSRILTIEDAVKHVGMAGVRKLIAACGIFETFSTGGNEQSLLQSWQHCLAVAILMEKLTPADESAPPGVPYVVGLCHDLADIVLRQHFCEEYARVLDLTARTGRPQRRVESAVFGMPYSELVSLLFSRLGLPGIAAAPIQEFFERSAFAQAPGSGSLMGRVLRIANIYAHGLMLAPSLDEPVLPLSKIECRNTFGEQTPAIDAELLRAEALTGAAALASGSAAATAMEPSIPKTQLRVCYARHREYAAMDPLYTLLKLTCKQVAIVSDLPSASDIQASDVLICTSSRSDENTKVMQTIDQLAVLTRSKLLPTLLLAGSQPAGKATIPKHIQVQRLPTSIQIVGSFLASASRAVEKRAA